MYLKITSKKELEAKRDLLGQAKAVDIADSDISDLSFLERCSSIRKLYLSGAPVRTLEHVAQCKGLELVSLSRTGVLDPSPLAACSIKDIYLDGAPISDSLVFEVLGRVRIHR